MCPLPVKDVVCPMLSDNGSIGFGCERREQSSLLIKWDDIDTISQDAVKKSSGPFHRRMQWKGPEDCLSRVVEGDSRTELQVFLALPSCGRVVGRSNDCLPDLPWDWSIVTVRLGGCYVSGGNKYCLEPVISIRIIHLRSPTEKQMESGEVAHWWPCPSILFSVLHQRFRAPFTCRATDFYFLCYPFLCNFLTLWSLSFFSPKNVSQWLGFLSKVIVSRKGSMCMFFLDYLAGVHQVLASCLGLIK